MTTSLDGRRLATRKSAFWLNPLCAFQFRMKEAGLGCVRVRDAHVTGYANAERGHTRYDEGHSHDFARREPSRTLSVLTICSASRPAPRIGGETGWRFCSDWSTSRAILRTCQPWRTVPNWRVGDTIPLGRKSLRVVGKSEDDADQPPILVVEEIT
jgi:hypothetical protein